MFVFLIQAIVWSCRWVLSKLGFSIEKVWSKF